jgi:hypothetical protein
VTSLVLPKFGRCSRRALLGSGLGGLFLAPFLRQRALEAKAVQPKRLVLAFTPDAHPREWWPLPDGQGGFTLRGPLLDFVGLESHLLFARQLDHSWTAANHHEAGMAQLFTGQRFFDEVTQYANGPSIEQVLLANTDLRGGTPVADAHLAVADTGGGDQRHVIAYSGPGEPIPHEASMPRAFLNLFSGVTFGGTDGASGGSELDARIKQAVLEVDGAQLRAIQSYLGQEERARLDLHLQSLQDLEAELRHRTSGDSVAAPPGCSAVSTNGLTLDDRDAQNVTQWSQVALELAFNAFVCDRTRVLDLAFGASGSHHSGLFGLSVDPADSWHDTAHQMRDDAARSAKLTLAGEQVDAASAFISFNRFWASQLATLARRLAETPEGDGSMLDNTLIYWGVESGTDHNHGPTDIPYLLIGGKNLGIQGGRLLSFSSAESAHKLHTSVLHAFGHTEALGFGIEETCGPLSGVLG